MSDKKSWNEIVEDYPDKWVALCDYTMEGVSIINARVAAVCSDNSRLEKEKELVNKNIAFIWRRTTDIERAFVL